MPVSNIKEEEVGIHELVPFARQLGLEIVTITVGSGSAARKYSIHKAVLCQNSEIFKKMFDNSFSESTRLAENLPEDDPNAFEVFIGWLYRGTVDTTPSPERFISVLLTKLFFFAEKYGIVPLMDNAMDLIVDNQRGRSVSFLPSHYKWVYEKTRQASKIRLYVAHTCAYLILTTNTDSTSGLWSNENLQKVLSSTFDLLHDVLALMRQKNGIEVPHPRDMPPCTFHQHADNEKCPYNKISKK